MTFGWLPALSYLAALTHPLLDLQNIYAAQLLSPFSAQWFHNDRLFIVSPWLLAMLGGGLSWPPRYFSQARYRSADRKCVVHHIEYRHFCAGMAVSLLRWISCESRPRVRLAQASCILAARGNLASGRGHHVQGIRPVASEARSFRAWSQRRMARTAQDGACVKITLSRCAINRHCVEPQFRGRREPPRRVLVPPCLKVRVPGMARVGA